MLKRYALLPLLALLATAAIPLNALAQLDSPGVSSIVAGKGKWVVDITAGSTGAPNGFTVWWMKKATFDAVGQQWFPTGNQLQASAYFTGTPTLNTWGGQLTSFILSPNQTAKIEIGDLADESGITQANALALAELEPGVEYVFCAWALGGGSVTASVYSANVTGSTIDNNCTYTQGYWKNHTNLWPVGSLTLGSVNYNAAQLLSILNQSVGGNGLISLAHQLIATKLNIANGADPSAIAATVANADALIGALVVPPVGAGALAPAATSALTQQLDDWNNGITGPGHCDATPTTPSTWGQVKASYR
jgi:hypothetical protein